MSAAGLEGDSRRWAISGGIVLAGFLILVVRNLAALTAPFVYAEDGSVFLQDALNHGWSLTSVYNGQIWLIERMAAYPLSQLPVTAFPQANYLTASLLTALAVSVVLQQRMRPLFGRYRYQVLAFALLILLPGTFEAALGLLTVYIWLPLSVALVIAAGPPRTSWGRYAEIAYVIIAGLTSLTTLLVLPVAVWMTITDRSRRRVVNLLTLGALAVLEVAVLVASNRQPGNSASLLDVGQLVMKKSGAVLLLGNTGTEAFWSPDTRVGLLLLAMILLAVVGVLAASRPKGPGLPLLASGLLYAWLGTYAAPEVGSLHAPFEGGRYFVLLTAAAVIVVVMALGTASGPPSPRYRRWVAGAALAAMTFGFIADLRQRPVPPLDEGALADFAACVDGRTEPCLLDIAPRPPWRIAVDPRHD